MEGQYGLFVDLNYENIMAVELEHYNLLIKDIPVAYNSEHVTHTLMRLQNHMLKKYSYEEQHVIRRQITRLFSDGMKENDLFDDLEIQGCKYNQWAVLFCPPTTMLFFSLSGDFHVLPIPVPISRDLLYPLAATWKKEHLVLFYKNLVNEKIHVAVFKVEETERLLELSCIYTTELDIKMRHFNLFPVYAYYFEVDDAEFPGIFCLKMRHDKTFIISHDFKKTWLLRIKAIAATKHMLAIMKNKQLIYCVPLSLFVEDIYKAGRMEQLEYIETNSIKLDPKIKLIQIPENSTFQVKLGVLDNDIYILKGNRPDVCSNFVRLDYSYKLMVNDKRDFHVYTRKLITIINKFLNTTRGISNSAYIVARNCMAGDTRIMHNKPWCAVCRYESNKYFLKMDTQVSVE